MAKRKTSKRARAHDEAHSVPDAPTAKSRLARALNEPTPMLEMIAGDDGRSEQAREHARACLRRRQRVESLIDGLSDDVVELVHSAYSLGLGIANAGCIECFGPAGAIVGRWAKQAHDGNKRLGGPEELERRRALARRLAETLRAESPGRLRSNRAAAAEIVEHPEWKALNYPTSPGQIARYLGNARDT